MLLTEIKYTESYASSYKRFRTDGTDRIEPYRDFFYGPSTPLDLTANARIEDFMYEPFTSSCVRSFWPAGSSK